MSNSSSILAYSLTTLVGLGGALQGAEEDTAALTRRIERLEKQNAALKASYVQARSDADKAAAQLVDIRSRLEALGGAALGNSEERLIQAMADIEAFNDRVQRLEQAIEEQELSVAPKTYDCLTTIFDAMEGMTLYTNKSFRNGSAARKVLERHLADRAAEDRAAVAEAIARGESLEEASAEYVSESSFEDWYASFCSALDAVVNE